jgi:hypothetical protein
MSHHEQTTPGDDAADVLRAIASRRRRSPAGAARAERLARFESLYENGVISGEELEEARRRIMAEPGPEAGEEGSGG